MNKKLIKLFKVLLVLFITISALFGIIYLIYKNTIDLSNKNQDKFDYVLNDSSVNTQTNDFMDFITYSSDQDLDSLTFTIPKDYFYKEIIKIDDFNNESISINRIGTISNPFNKNSIDFYCDLTILDSINMYANGILHFETNSTNGLDIYLDKFVIGDGLPMFFYKEFLPFKDGDLIYSINSDEFELLKKNIIVFDSIENYTINKNTIEVEYSISDSLAPILEYAFKDKISLYSDVLNDIAPILLEIKFGSNSSEFEALLNDFLLEQ